MKQLPQAQQINKCRGALHYRHRPLVHQARSWSYRPPTALSRARYGVVYEVHYPEQGRYLVNSARFHLSSVSRQQFFPKSAVGSVGARRWTTPRRPAPVSARQRPANQPAPSSQRQRPAGSALR